MTFTTIYPAGAASQDPQSVARSDGKPSDLVEAVAALNVETPLKPPKRPPAAPIQAEDREGVDSGYASKSSTPKNSKSGENFGPFVVANTSSSLLTRRKKTKLSPFEKEIPKSTQNRFEDLRELYADRLNSLGSGIAKRRGILMTLKVLGENEEKAEPWVFVQCDKTIAKKVRRFFKEPSVVSDFQPSSPSKFTPKLDIYVHELPLLLLGRSSPTSSTSKKPSPTTQKSVELYNGRGSNLHTLCGSKIVVTINGQRRSATVGGVISVETAEGSIEHFGMTAGHFLNEDCNMEGFDEEVQEGLDADEQGTDDDTDEEVSDDEQDFELDLGPSEETGHTFLLKRTAVQAEESSSISIGSGHVFCTSQENLQGGPNLDWALFAVDNKLKLPNIVFRDEITTSRTFRSTVYVELSTVSRGHIYGTLSDSWSYLTLAPGNGLVRMKALKLADYQVLQPGDSGSWVVDPKTDELFGHVVASDVFGVCYVVPASDVFKDIQSRLNWKAVNLPSSATFVAASESQRDIGHAIFTRNSRLVSAPPKPKDNFLLWVLQKLKMRKKSSKDVQPPKAEATTNPSQNLVAEYFQDSPQSPSSPVSEAPVTTKGFPDSGYSTMTNTPLGSTQSSPAPEMSRPPGLFE